MGRPSQTTLRSRYKVCVLSNVRGVIEMSSSIEIYKLDRIKHWE